MRRIRLRSVMVAIAMIALVCALVIQSLRARIREQQHRANEEMLRAELLAGRAQAQAAGVQNARLKALLSQPAAPGALPASQKPRQ